VPAVTGLDIDQIVTTTATSGQPGFLGYTINSIVVTTITVVIALVLATPAAYAFSRIEFARREGWANTILSLRFMPAVAVAIPILLMMRFVTLDDTLPGLVIPYVAFSLPLAIWILIGFFDEIPRELDDAAMVDGCTRSRVLWSVMLPLVRPGLIVAAIFAAIFDTGTSFLVACTSSTRRAQDHPAGCRGPHLGAAAHRLERGRDASAW